MLSKVLFVVLQQKNSYTNVTLKYHETLRNVPSSTIDHQYSKMLSKVIDHHLQANFPKICNYSKQATRAFESMKKMLLYPHQCNLRNVFDAHIIILD